MEVAVVILNWNGRKMLEKYLPSVVAHCKGVAEVVIADNGSTDDSLAFLAEHYPTLRIIAMDCNYGFAEGYNRALAEIESDYYILLNDDVEVPEGWIEPVIEMMERNPEVAIAQPKLLMYDQRDTFEYAGGAGGYIDRHGYPFCRGRLFTTLEKDEGQYDDERDIFWASGAAMFVRASVWHELGGLDIDFFAHMEEIDLCWRAQNRGYKVRYCPKSRVYHLGGGTLPKSSPHKTFLNFRNNMALLYKNMPEKRLRRTLMLRGMLDLVAAVKFAAEGNPRDAWAVLKAHWAFAEWKPELRLKRENSNNEKKIAPTFDKLLLVQYYILGKHKFSKLIWKEK